MEKKANIPFGAGKTPVAERRCVHMRLYKETYYGLRAALFSKKISLQELFQEFSFLIMSEDARAVSIIQDVIDRKKSKEKAKFLYRADPNFKGADEEMLYELITQKEDS